MITTNLIDLLLENKIAQNVFQAAHIANGLRLSELHGNTEAQVKRMKLYRDWRNAGEKSKVAYEKAIAGDIPPSPMFDGILHSESETK